MNSEHSEISARLAGPQAPPVAHAQEKMCDKCQNPFKGWGDTCSSCRKIGRSRASRASLSQLCSKCGEYYSGFGDSCAECKGGGDVHIYVYDLEHTNDVQYKVFQHALYHASVEIHGKEWSFGGGSEVGFGGGCGIVYLTELGKDRAYLPNPKRLHQGFTKLNPQQVEDLLREMAPAWGGETYDLLSRNCCHFAEAFLERLGVQPLPKWVNRAAKELPGEAIGFVTRTGITTGTRFALSRGAVALGAVGAGAAAGPASIPAFVGELAGGRIGGHIGEAMAGDDGQETMQLHCCRGLKRRSWWSHFLRVVR